MDHQEEFVDFQKIKQYINIKDISNFMEYLREIYNDLSSRDQTTKKSGMSKISFLDYMKLPIFIGEKLFVSFDLDNNNYLSLQEFLRGMKNLYCGNFEETITQIFRLLDFDKDKFVTKGDVKLLLSYLPIKSDNSQKDYLYQMESLSEIDSIVSQTFSSNEKLNLKQFTRVVEEKKSDVYIQVLCFLYQNKPFNEDNISNVPVFCKRNSLEIQKDLKVSSPITNKKIPSPSHKTILSPVLSFLSISGEENTDEYGTMIRMHNEKIPNSNNKKEIEQIIKDSKDVYNSPSKFLQKNKKVVSEFCLENNLISLNLDDSESEEEVEKNNHNNINENSSHKSRSKSQNETMEGELFKLSKNHKLKKLYLVLIGKDLYYYPSSNKETLIKMQNLTACYMKETYEKRVSGDLYYAFQIKIKKEPKIFLSKSKDDIMKWCIQIKNAIGYLNFFDYYSFVNQIGEGKFGLVKLGIHKKTKEKVAIKIINKELMKDNDIELVKNEIDIMKLCHHPNIVRLLDHFENSDYIFIIMEYFSGGDLDQYIKRNKKKITESKASSIIYQIANGLKYLQDFGIIHRDLKPGNIMLSDPTDKGIIKIMDFGLSKIVGPQEKLEDGFGTLSFVAPEVLLRSPYNKQIDIWSLGVILYYLLSGELPFDDKNDNEEVIAKKIVFKLVKFKSPIWERVSSDVIALIRKCLLKNPEERITIEGFLSDPWVIKGKA